MIRKLFVTGDLGVVDLEFLLACVYVDPNTNKPFESLERFVAYSTTMLGRPVVAADLLSDSDRLAIVRSLELVFCSHTVHGKSLVGQSQIARTSAAGRAAAAARAESSATLVGGAGLDSIGLKQFAAYSGACYDARSLDAINANAAMRAELLIGREQLDHRRHSQMHHSSLPRSSSSCSISTCPIASCAMLWSSQWAIQLLPRDHVVVIARCLRRSSSTSLAHAIQRL